MILPFSGRGRFASESKNRCKIMILDPPRARAHRTRHRSGPSRRTAVDAGTRTAAGFAIQSRIAEFCVESEAVAPCSFAGRRAGRAGGTRIEESAHRLHHRVGDLAAPGIRGHGLEVLLV